MFVEVQNSAIVAPVQDHKDMQGQPMFLAIPGVFDGASHLYIKCPKLTLQGITKWVTYLCNFQSSIDIHFV